MIYFDNAATTPMSEVAIEALISVSKENFGNASSIYSYGKKSRKLLDESRKIIANCIGAEPEEIYFTSGGTESDNWAVEQVACHNIEHIITSQVEHHAILNPVKKLEEKGVKATYLPVNSECIIDLNALQNELDGKVKFVTLMYQNNETGVIQAIKEAARLVHEDNHSSIFHTDAVQAVGHTRINVKELGVDMLSASAHKFNGPKGIGFLYVKRGLNICPFIAGGGQEFGLRSGTENVAGIFAMAKALEENLSEMDEIESRIMRLENRFFEGLEKNDIEYLVNGAKEKRALGVINLSLKNIDAEGLLNVLDIHQIAISIGSACNSKTKEPSYVLLAMDLDEKRVESAVRVSIGKYNSQDEIEALVNNIRNYYKLVN